MKFSIRFADQVVGTLVVLALAILIFVIFMLGRNQRWFANDHEYRTFFPSASGISPNMPITLRGFNIGHVKSLSLTDEDMVEVIFTIFEEYGHRVTEGSLVEVQSSPIGLGSSFLFYPGRGTEPIDGDIIPEVNSLEARILISMGLANIPRANDSISSIMNQVSTLLETFNTSFSDFYGAEDLPLGLILVQINDLLEIINTSLSGNPGAADYTLGQLMQNIENATASLSTSLPPVLENLKTSLPPVLENLETLTDQLADPSGTIMAILDAEGPFYSSIEEAIVSLAGIIQNLEKTSEFIPTQLPQIGILISEVNTTIVTLHDVLVALTNNPLLRGGIPERRETGPGGASPRNLNF